MRLIKPSKPTLDYMPGIFFGIGFTSNRYYTINDGHVCDINISIILFCFIINITLFGYKLKR
jgi:hypothetical protein